MAEDARPSICDDEAESNGPKLCGSLGCTRGEGHAGLCAVPAPLGKRNSGARRHARTAQLETEARAKAELLRAHERAATVGPWEPLLFDAHGQARDPGWLLSSTELRRDLSRSGCGTDGAWEWLHARSLPSLASVG